MQCTFGLGLVLGTITLSLGYWLGKKSLAPKLEQLEIKVKGLVDRNAFVEANWKESQRKVNKIWRIILGQE